MTSNWKTVRLGELADRRVERVILDPSVNERLMGVRWKNLGAYERGQTDTTPTKAKTMFRMREGDFVFNRIDTDKGAFCVVGPEMHMSVASNEFPAYVFDPELLSPAFLWLHFQQESVLSDLKPAGSDGRARWKEADFESHRIAIPPLAEQRRIINLMCALDEALETAEEQRVALQECAKQLRHEFFSVPSKKVLLGDVYEVSAGKQLQAKIQTGVEIAYLRAGNIGDGELDLNVMKRMFVSEAEADRLALQPGDVVVVEGGNGYGKSSVWEGWQEDRVVFQNHVIRIRQVESARYSSGYAAQWARWCHEQGQFKYTGTGIPNIGVSKVRAMEIPLQSHEKSLPEILQIALASDLAAQDTKNQAVALRALRAELLTSLLSGAHTIPDSYDELLEAVDA